MGPFVLRELPLFSTFFFSSLGFGGMIMARPLFAASFNAPLFMIALLNTASATASLIGAPIAGALTDRWGRRPLVVGGLSVRVLTGFASFFAGSYEEFFVYEFVGSLGLSFWNTGVNVIVADITTPENRGRAIALRTASQRLGVLCGPLLAGLLAGGFGVRSLFLLNAASKMAALAIFVMFTRETRPARSATPVGGTAAALESFGVRTLLSRPFLVLALTSLAIYMISTGGAFEALFPLHATQAGLSTVEIGQALTVLTAMSFFVSFPGGMAADRWGRKAVLLPGLLLLAAGAYLLSGVTGFGSVLLALAVLGLGDGLSTGATLVLAMDLAPATRRGAFLGVWMVVERTGGAAAPLMLGAVAQGAGIGTAFLTVAVSLLAATVVMWRFGPETHKRRAPAPAVTPADPPAP